LAADVAAYTRLMELDEEGTVSAWRQARAEVIDPTVGSHGGRIVKLTGDGFLAEFRTVESAVKAALSMQSAFTSLFGAMPVERRVAFRAARGRSGAARVVPAGLKSASAACRCRRLDPRQAVVPRSGAAATCREAIGRLETPGTAVGR
jgi:class 3 adenylate cyclase